MKPSSCHEAVAGASSTRTAANAAGSPNAKRTAVTCSKDSLRERKRGRARQRAGRAAATMGRRRTTRMACSPRTIVAAWVECASGRRSSASVPHSPAATATAATPTLALLIERITLSRSEIVETLPNPPEQEGHQKDSENDRDPIHEESSPLSAHVQAHRLTLEDDRAT